jgi:hypothetical protein
MLALIPSWISISILRASRSEPLETADSTSEESGTSLVFA